MAYTAPFLIRIAGIESVFVKNFFQWIDSMSAILYNKMYRNKLESLFKNQFYVDNL